MNLIQFRDLLITRFTLSELNSLCFDLNILYEELPGDTLRSKGEGLIDYCRRRSLLPRLWERCRELRPEEEWPALALLLEESRDAAYFQQTPPTPPARQGNSYSVQVGGNVGPGAQIAAGENINQVQIGRGGEATNLLAELRAAIRAELTPAAAESAEKEVAALQAELTAGEPNLSRLQQLQAYFQKLGGRVAAAATAVFKSEAGQAALKMAAEIVVTAALKGFGG
jgi:hypothetical protein